ncbi:MAG: DUF2029 domain-containing protein [Deltaproteobacteria bacterium]|nr:DUF2029 domain-containing protein [Deltaproteobacteria bacterium]
MKSMLFAVAAFVQAGCYAGLLLLGNLREHIPEALGLFALAFVLYTLTLRLLLRATCPECRETAPDKGLLLKNHYLLSVLGLALLYRCIMLPAVPWLSDDIYRYIWEGSVVSQGYNPFALAPDAPALAHLRDAEIYPLVSRKDLPAIYPPCAQFIFALASGIKHSVVSMKIAFTLFDLATIGLLLLTLAALHLYPLKVAVYALNPLVIMEFSGSGHLDSAGIFFMVLALYLYVCRKSLWPAAALALSFLVKLFPALLLPAIITKRTTASALVFFCLSAVALLPFVDAGSGLFYSLGLYTRDWMFNSPLHTVMLLLVKDNQIARLIAAIIFTAIAAGIYYRYFKKQNREEPKNACHTCFMLIGAFLLCMPVVHPWYLCWIVPFLAIFPSRAWIFLSGAVFGSYWILREYSATGLWLESPAVLCSQYIPFFSLLLYDWRSQFCARRKSCAAA